MKEKSMSLKDQTYSVNLTIKANTKKDIEKVLTKEKRLQNKRFNINNETIINFKLLILN